MLKTHAKIVKGDLNFLKVCLNNIKVGLNCAPPLAVRLRGFMQRLLHNYKGASGPTSHPPSPADGSAGSSP